MAITTDGFYWFFSVADQPQVVWVTQSTGRKPQRVIYLPGRKTPAPQDALVGEFIGPLSPARARDVDRKRHYEDVDYWRRPTDLSVETTLSILEQAETRTRKDDSGKAIHEIFYDGRWRRLGRVDLHNQAGTFSSSPSVEAQIDASKRRCVFGARIGDNAFMVIDSFTDG